LCIFQVKVWFVFLCFCVSLDRFGFVLLVSFVGFGFFSTEPRDWLERTVPEMTYFVSTGQHRNDLYTVCSIPYHARPFNRRDRRNYVFALSVCACVCTCSPRILQPACRLQFIFVVFFVYTTAFPAGTSRDLPLAVLSLL